MFGRHEHLSLRHGMHENYVNIDGATKNVGDPRHRRSAPALPLKTVGLIIKTF